MADEPGVVIAGAAFAHRLYPFAFAHSGCRHVSVVIGGESFQAALWMAGGVPKEHRTDSLSATFNNLAEQEELTRNYDGLCAHFILCTDGFRATIRSEELQELLTEPDPSAACARSEALAAKRGGGGDNVTLALLQPRWPVAPSQVLAAPCRARRRAACPHDHDFR